MARLELGDRRALTRNWSGTSRLQPADVAHPSTNREVVHHIARATAHGTSIRLVGAAHSFTPLSETSGTLMTLDNYRGLVSIDSETGDATVRGGTRLRELGPMLAVHGRALINMGDVDPQSIAGAISTGTHGMGHAMQGLAAMVTGLRMALASGDVVWCDADTNPLLFQAARLGLGTLGIILEVRIKTVPRYRLDMTEENRPVADTVTRYAHTSGLIDHQELFWFPGTDRVCVREMRRVDQSAKRRRRPRAIHLFETEVINNAGFELMCRIGTAQPRVVPAINSLVSRLMPSSAMVDDSYAVFAASRRVRFKESEFAIPTEAFADAFAKLQSVLASRRHDVTFPMEIRRSAADDVWLSTAYQRDTVYIAAHMYHRQQGTEYLRLIQDTLMEFNPRPHWGKLHWLDAEYFAAEYPMFEQFTAVRRDVDPTGLFMNEHTRRVFGA